MLDANVRDLDTYNIFRTAWESLVCKFQNLSDIHEIVLSFIFVDTKSQCNSLENSECGNDQVLFRYETAETD